MTTAAAEHTAEPAPPGRFLRTWLFLELLPAFAAVAMLLSNHVLYLMFNGHTPEPDLPPVLVVPFEVGILVFALGLLMVLVASMMAVVFGGGIGWLASGRIFVGLAIGALKAILSWMMLKAAAKDYGWFNEDLRPVTLQVVALSAVSAIGLWYLNRDRVQ